MNIYPCPAVVFTPNTNDLTIYLTTTSEECTGGFVECSIAGDPNNGKCGPPTSSTISPTQSCAVAENASSIEHTTITNVPIQKWTNVTISVYGRSLDVYLDGKLVQTKPLAGTAEVDPNASVFITPAGGFSGWTSKFAYYPNALNPQEVWDIYAAGYGFSWLSNLFGKYNVKISFLENGTEDSSFTF
jgi:hypothetical protein